jgi:2-polyprenyl-6-methoxyphenol hydroxylase-like FAD-dependent oxidoreductase
VEDKLPEGHPLGVENVWQAKVVGDSQVFQKEEASSVYAVVALRSVHWPGWVTVGYVPFSRLSKEDSAAFMQAMATRAPSPPGVPTTPPTWQRRQRSPSSATSPLPRRSPRRWRRPPRTLLRSDASVVI